MKTISRSLAVSLLFSLAIAGASGTPAPVGPVAGDVYVSESPLLLKIGTDGTQSVVPTTVAMPSGMAFDKNGDIYLADSTTNSVVKIAPDGTETTVATGLANPKDLALDTSGNLYIANADTNSVVKVATDGTKTTFATGLNNPDGLVFDPTGNLLVSSAGADAIFKIAPDGTKTTFVGTGLNNPAGLAYDANGNLLVADTGSGSILKVDRDGNVSTKTSGLNAPSDVAVDALGDLLVANTGNNSIVKVSPTGTKTPIATGLIAPEFVNMAPGLHQLLDVSTRGYVETGDHVLIGGFILRGSPDADVGQTTVLARAIGPSLPATAVPDPLLNPVLELHDSTGALIATNDDWKDTQEDEIKATGLAPTKDKESAIEATLPDGTYTAIVRGANDTIGIALVEVYKIQ